MSSSTGSKPGKYVLSVLDLDVIKMMLKNCYFYEFMYVITSFLYITDKSDQDEVSPLQGFLNAVLPNKKVEEVSYVEFEEYYEGLSLSVADDEDFFTILRNTWTL